MSKSMQAPRPIAVLQEGECEFEAEDSEDEYENGEGEEDGEEVQYSDGTSFCASDSDSEKSAQQTSESESVHTDNDEEEFECGDCSTFCSVGRVDKSDGVWYCEACWAAFEQCEGAVEEDENRPEKFACAQAPSPANEASVLHQEKINWAFQGLSDTVSVRRVEPKGKVWSPSAPDLEGAFRQSCAGHGMGKCAASHKASPDTVVPNAAALTTSARCSVCFTFEAGGHTDTFTGEHFCDFCWDERCLPESDGIVDERVPRVECSLPIAEFRGEIMHRIRTNTVTSIFGETGCGKSSMVPQFILDDCLKRGENVRIMVTQPRRIAAINLARRVASQRGQALGNSVGYRCGNRDHVDSKHTKITFCTVGYLLAFLSHNHEYLRRNVTHLVLDEVHERTTDAEMLNFLVKKLMESSTVKVVAMSATLQTNVFGNYFTPSSEEVQPAIFVGVKRFQVQQIFLETLATHVPGISQGLVDKVAAQGQGKPKFLGDALKLLVQCVEALAAPDTTILVFLPGIDEICEVQEEIEKRAVLNISVHVLHSQVEQEDQDLAIAPPPPDICKIILSTNIAESSITIPNVEVVIDSGLVRGIFYDNHRQIQCLLCKWCSRASVTQRAGRTGRLKDGICIHLMTAAFHDRLSPFDVPEILRTPLTKTILNVKLLFQAFGTPSQILGQFIDPPPLSSVRIAIEELYKTGATTGNSEDAAVTYLGKAATELPVDLPLCKLLLLGSAMAATNACCIMGAALALQFDVFALPMALFMRDSTDFASELASNFSSRVKFDEGQYSQPLMYLNVYKAWLASSRDHLWCKRNKLNFPRMRQFDHLVVTLAGRMRPLLQQHGLIPDLIDKLEAAAGSKSPLTEKEAEVITQGSDLNVLRFILAGSFSQILLVGGTSQSDGAERDARENKFDPKKTLAIGHVIPKETAVLTVLDGLAALLSAADMSVDNSWNEQPIQFDNKSRKYAVPTFAKNKHKKGASVSSSGVPLSSAEGMDLSELCSTYMSEQQGRVKISRAKKLCKGKSAEDVVHLQSGELLLIEFDDNRRPDAHGKGDKKRDTLTEDVTFPVKVALQLFKQNRGKFFLPNPKFVAGGDEAEIIQINHMYSARNVTWRLKGGQVQVFPPSRQPISMMSDFSSETRIATAFSLMGTEHPNKVNAEGVTLLPSGTFSSFLVLVFTTRDTNVRFLCTQSQEGVLLGAALCDNVVLEIANRFDLTQINVCRRILSNAIAGHLVSTKDRRNIKQILADIVMKSKSISAHSDSLFQEGSVEWVVCFTEENEASEYLPPFHLEHTYYREKPQTVINCHDMLERKKLHHVIDKILMPLLNARRMALHELNEIVMSNASVPRSEVGVLVSYFDAHHNAFIFKSQVSSDSTYEQVVVSTPQFEDKQEQNEELLSNLYAYRAGAEPGMLTGAPAATMRFGRKLEEEVSLQVSKASSDHLLETCNGDVQGDEIQKQKDERNEQVAEAAALKDRTEEDEDENRRLLLILLGNEGSEVGSAGEGVDVAPANVAPELSLSQQDCKFPAEVSSAVQVQGEANCVCIDTTISFTDRLRALETSLIALLRQNRKLTIQSLNQKVFEKNFLRSICQQLFLDFQEKIEGSQSKVLKTRQNPFEENGSVKVQFFENRKAIFTTGGGTGMKKDTKIMIALKADHEISACFGIEPDSDSTTSGAPGVVEPVVAPLHELPSAPNSAGAKKVENKGGSSFHGVHLAHGWQEWTTPDCRKYYFHPETQVSQWEQPLMAAEGTCGSQQDSEKHLKAAEGIKDSQQDSKHQLVGEDKCIELQDLVSKLELSLVALLQHDELGLDKLNEIIHMDPSTREIVNKLSDYVKQRRARDMGIGRQDCKLKRDYFDARPHIFQTRSEGNLVLVSVQRTEETESAPQKKKIPKKPISDLELRRGYGGDRR